MAAGLFPIRLVDVSARRQDRLSSLLKSFGLAATDDDVKQLAPLVRDWGLSDRRIFGDLTGCLCIDWDAMDGGEKERLEPHLRKLIGEYRSAPNDEVRGIVEMKMFAATCGLDEHPTWFDYPCLCATCLSYG